MKTIFLLILTLPFFTSCDKDNNDTSNPSNNTSPISATINGKAWASGKVNGEDAADAFITNLGAVEIYGYAPTGSETITIQILDKKDMVAGKTLNFIKFDINSLNFGNTADYIISDANGIPIKAFHSSSGMIKFTAVSATNIKGTFSFEAENEYNPSEIISVKDGKFDMPLR